MAKSGRHQPGVASQSRPRARARARHTPGPRLARVCGSVVSRARVCQTVYVRRYCVMGAEAPCVHVQVMEASPTVQLGLVGAAGACAAVGAGSHAAVATAASTAAATRLEAIVAACREREREGK